LSFDDRELSRLRSISNSVVARANSESRTQALVQVRRTPQGADITLNYRSGTEMPGDPLSYLGDLIDGIRNELRLEKNRIGDPLYETTESTFDSGDEPRFQFQVRRKEYSDIED